MPPDPMLAAGLCLAAAGVAGTLAALGRAQADHRDGLLSDLAADRHRLHDEVRHLRQEVDRARVDPPKVEGVVMHHEAPEVDCAEVTGFGEWPPSFVEGPDWPTSPTPSVEWPWS